MQETAPSVIDRGGCRQVKRNPLFMSFVTHTCPIWNWIGDDLLAKALISPQICYSSRAGGPCVLQGDGAAVLRSPTVNDMQRANLSYLIYSHNFCNPLFDDWRMRIEDLIVLDQAWVLGHWHDPPPYSDRALMPLCEMIRCTDAGKQPDQELLKAAGGCHYFEGWEKLWQHVEELGGITIPPGHRGYPHLYSITESGRSYVSEKLRQARLQPVGMGDVQAVAVPARSCRGSPTD